MDVTDTATETRWRDYLDAVNHSGVRSIHSIPFGLGQAAAGSLNLYSTTPHAFPGPGPGRDRICVEQASATLRLALHIADLTNSRQGIQAIVSRTHTTLALGILVGRHDCTKTTAFALLQQMA